MPRSCKCILDRMVHKGAMSKEDRDKIVRNLKTNKDSRKMTKFEIWLNSLPEWVRNYKIGKMFCYTHFGCNDCEFKELCKVVIDEDGIKIDRLPYAEIGRILLQEVDENGCQENNQKEGH